MFQKDNKFFRKSGKLKIHSCLNTFFLLLTLMCFLIVHWTVKTFGNISINQIIYTLNTSVEGTSPELVKSFIWTCILIPSIIVAFIYILIHLISKKGMKTKKTMSTYRPFMIPKRLIPFISITLLAISLIQASSKFDFINYVKASVIKTKIYENNYVDPRSVTMTFPEKKRNLIYIFLESMENTHSYSHGTQQVNLIPELTRLAQKNVSFSKDLSLNGAIETTGDGFTAGAMVAYTSGVPLISPLGGNEYGSGTFLPGVYSLGEVLEKNNYNQVLLMGSDASFANRNNYFTQHGHYQILDYNYAKENELIPSDYHVWWGYEDKKLYSFAKDELQKLAQEDQPFNFTMLTADMHNPGGFICNDCQNEFSEQFENVVQCADNQIGDFIRWVQAQDFYENTTIIITGDHPSMDGDYFKKIGLNKIDRTVYNVIINPVDTVDPSSAKNRLFTKMDFYPTTLASLGVNISGEKLGLGTNLFSKEKTLAEQLGMEKVTKELSYYSKFYNQTLLYGK